MTYELKAPGAKRRAKRSRLGKQVNIPSLLFYQKLLKFMNSVDIGTFKGVNLDFCDNLNDDDKVQGKYKELGEVLLNLAELYLAMRQTGTVKLNWFNNHHVFTVAI